MTQNEPGGIVALATQPQQTLIQAERQFQFAEVHVIGRLSIGNMKELRGRTEFLPQFLRAGISTACFRRCVAFHHQ